MGTAMYPRKGMKNKKTTGKHLDMSLRNYACKFRGKHTYILFHTCKTSIIKTVGMTALLEYISLYTVKDKSLAGL